MNKVWEVKVLKKQIKEDGTDPGLQAKLSTAITKCNALQIQVNNLMKRANVTRGVARGTYTVSDVNSLINIEMSL